MIILFKINLNDSSVVKLYDYDKITGDFKIDLDGIIYNCNLKFGDMGAEIDPTITVVDGSKKYFYEKFCGKTSLHDYSFTDDRNFTFNRYISSMGYCSSYFNEEYKLGLSVSYNNMMKDNEVPFINELNELITQVVFPLDIADFSNKVFNLLEGYDCGYYNRINITFYKFF